MGQCGSPRWAGNTRTRTPRFQPRLSGERSTRPDGGGPLRPPETGSGPRTGTLPTGHPRRADITRPRRYKRPPTGTGNTPSNGGDGGAGPPLLHMRRPRARPGQVTDRSRQSPMQQMPQHRARGVGLPSPNHEPKARKAALERARQPATTATWRCACAAWGRRRGFSGPWPRLPHH